MDENMRLIPEIGFNIFYLIFIWILVIKMFRSTGYHADKDQGAGHLLRLAFLVLAIGDTGHVGFRLWAYALGDVEASVNVFGVPMPLIGTGALLTSFLVTVFYMLMAEVERRYFNKSWDLVYFFLLAAGLIRFVLMCMPGNHWANSMPPADWSLYRNIPLSVLGVGLAILMMVHARQRNNRLFTYFSILILISFAFYLPVILFVQKVPIIGMLMIPKTIAYLLMAVAVYRNFFKKT